MWLGSLWCRLAAAALIQPLALGLLYVAGAILKRKKRGEREEKKKRKSIPRKASPNRGIPEFPLAQQMVSPKFHFLYMLGKQDGLSPTIHLPVSGSMSEYW